MALENLPFILQALITGIISFASPCSLAILPSFFAFLTSSAKNRSESFILSLIYTVGFSLTYGIIFTLITVGLAQLNTRFYFNIIAGSFTILVSIYLFFLNEIQQFFRKRKALKKTSMKGEPTKNHSSVASDTPDNFATSEESNVPDSFKENSNAPNSHFYAKMASAFTLGFSAGGASNACASALLATLITVSSSQPPTIMLYMMIFYGIGLMVPFLIIGVIIGEISNRVLAKMIVISAKISKIFAVILFWFGLEILFGSLGYELLLNFI